MQGSTLSNVCLRCRIRLGLKAIRPIPTRSITKSASLLALRSREYSRPIARYESVVRTVPFQSTRSVHEGLSGPPKEINSLSSRPAGTSDTQEPQGKEEDSTEEKNPDEPVRLEPENIVVEENPAEPLQLNEEEGSVIGAPQTEPLPSENVAQNARNRFGDQLPPGFLNDEEYQVYERLYGKPLSLAPEPEDQAARDEAVQPDERDSLFREGQDGSLEEIQYGADELEQNTVDQLEDQSLSKAVEGDGISDTLGENDSRANVRLQQDIEQTLSQPDLEDNAALEELQLIEDEPHDSNVRGEELRAHQFTINSRSGTSPSTVYLPKPTIAGPVGVMLADLSNKHIDEAAHRVFGGRGLPYSTGTPQVSRTLPQKPIPLSPYQTRMDPLEADLYMAVLLPGLYACLTNILVETRRRLGSRWTDDLLQKEGGPSFFDAGAGGAGVLAWQDVLRAEWKRMHDHKGPGAAASEQPSLPYGKSTVLASSSTLRQRSSLLLQNTTFLPRVPDYVHISHNNANSSSQRKQFDVIVAPHSLWPLEEAYMRRQHVQNLWSMLNPDGGILVLLEKGVPRGFEALAEARGFLLDELFTPSSAQNASGPSHHESDENTRYPRHHGSIVAPCTTHSKCPMYRIPGVSRRRKDYCHFSQRYILPGYLQRILGARSRNHDDVEFSYLVVQKGVKPEELRSNRVAYVDGKEQSLKASADQVKMGMEASNRAFQGYDLDDGDLAIKLSEGQTMESPVTAQAQAAGLGDHMSSSAQREPTASTSDEPRPELPESLATSDSFVLTTPPPPHTLPHSLTLPRIVATPQKRHGHVMFDVCTPAGALERWTVPRSFGKQAYRDARKSRWGDLWALGAKTRLPKEVKSGLGNERRKRPKNENFEEEDEEVVPEAPTRRPDNDDGNDDGDGVSKKNGKLKGREKARRRKREANKAMSGRAPRRLAVGDDNAWT